MSDALNSSMAAITQTEPSRRLFSRFTPYASKRFYLFILKAVGQNIDMMKDAFLVLDNEQQYMKSNSAFIQIFPQAKTLKNGMRPCDMDMWPEQLSNLDLIQEKNTDIEFTLEHNGAAHYYTASVNRISSVKNINRGWIIFIHDITDIAVLMNKLERFAYIDGLTGIYNRRHFFETAEKVFQKYLRTKNPCSIMIIDLDHFKKVNDTYGHMAGDMVLKSVAESIEKVLRPYDLLARYGGEEFIVFTETDEKDAVSLAKRINEKISSMICTYKDKQIKCTASIGVAVKAEDTPTLKDIIRNADIALYRAKSYGRNRVEMYSDSELELCLTRAAEDGFNGFELFYQPIFSTRSRQCIGAECLIRWQSYDAGMVMPGTLTPLLEKLGMMMMVDKWALTEACLQCREWMELFNNPRFYVHVNLSHEFICSRTLCREVLQAVEQSGITENNIILEFKEKLLSPEYGSSSAMLQELSKRNIRMAIDGYGYGASSFNRLKNIFVDELRIDKSFISNIEYDETARKLLTGIINIGKHMDHQICVLGVETEWQMEFLQENTVDTFQGYLLGKPMNRIDFQNKYITEYAFMR